MKVRHLALAIAISLATASPTWAITGPAPPQEPGTADGIIAPAGKETGANIDPGDTLFVDPIFPGGIQGPCRYIEEGTQAPAAGEWVPLGSTMEYQDYRYGINSHGAPPYVTEQVCCRPQTATLCEGGASAGPVDMTLPYTVLGQVQSPTAQCTDIWGKTYTDTQTWTCGQTGVGVNADGQWNEGSDTLGACSPNAFVSGCTASCGGGTSTVYDSCGNVQAVNACNTQPCCTSNWVKSCSGTEAFYTDTGSCHDPGYSIQGGCTEVQTSCSSSCQVGSHQTTAISTNQGTSVICETEYEDCASWTGSTAGGINCTQGTYQASYSTVCTDGFTKSGTNLVTNSWSCTCISYQ